MTLPVTVELAGVGSRPRPVQPPSDAIYLAALMLAARLYHRAEAPLGIQGGFDFGAMYVRTRDPDIQNLLRGHRGRRVSVGQRWPTVAEVRARARIGSDVADVVIGDAIAAVVEHLRSTLPSWGVA